MGIGALQDVIGNALSPMPVMVVVGSVRSKSHEAMHLRSGV